MVDHFKVMRLIGRGGMGEVYVARDTKLGRRVALKIVSSRHLQSPEALAAFRREATTTAKFSHPNIVTLHGVGEYEGRPYVALEYLEGQNLALRIREQHPGLAESMRIGLAVARALAEAHAHDVLHLDLKPGNVVIASDGRPRVVDFGLATTMTADVDAPPGRSDSTAAVFGTPAYTSPERWRAGPASVATDIWSLGVILFELCAQRLPFAADSTTATRDEILRPDPAPRLDQFVDVPRELADLVAACLEKSPDKRPPAAEVAEALERLLGSRTSSRRDEECPFRGLLPFDQRHADVFFGRDAEVDAFVERLRQTPVLPVVGPPGSGKSSFVHAGVVPRLREQEPWIVLHVRPGGRPFATLADRLQRRETLSFTRSGEIVTADRSTTAGPRSITRRGEVSGAYDFIPMPEPAAVAELEESPRSLSLALRAIADDERTKVLLVVDRLEELFTMVEDVDVRRRFIEAICTAADDPLDPVRVIFTVRDDLLGRLSFSPQVRNVLGHVTVVQHLDEAALRETMRLPVEAVGYRYEDPELVSEMCAAVAGEPACLPMLQFAGQMLWEHRDEKRRLLLRSAYTEMGGVEGALARHADSVLAGCNDEEFRIARDLLLRLVTPERTRRVIALESVINVLTDVGESVLARLTESRLVSVTQVRDTTGSQSQLELAHESLIDGWSTLSRWIDETRDELAFLGQASTAAELWDKRGRLPEELWQGDALQRALAMRERLSTDVPVHVDRFLDESRAAGRARGRKRQIALASGVGALAIVTAAAISVSVFVATKEREARQERNEAQRQREVAGEQRELAEGQRAEALRESSRVALGAHRNLEARTKLRLALEYGDNATARAQWWALEADPVLWSAEIGTFGVAVDASPDGAYVATGCQDSAVCLYDIDTRDVQVLRGHREKVSALAYSHDGRWLAAGDWASEIILWSLETGRAERMLQGHGERVLALDFSPDDRLLASASRDRTVRLWDVATGGPAGVFEGHQGDIEGLSFHPDGDLLASGSEDKQVRVWAVPSGKKLRAIGHDAAVEDVAFSPDGTLLASASTDGVARLWRTKSGRIAATLRGHGGGVRSVSFAPDGETLVTASYDTTVRLWNVRSGDVETVLRGHTGGVRDARFARGGRWIVSTAYDDTVRLWNAEAEPRQFAEEGHTGAARGVAWSPDMRRLASGGFDRTVRVWDADTGEQTAVLEGHDGGVYGVAFDPFGRWLASASADATVRTWDLATGREERVLRGHDAAVYAVSFTPDGGHVVSGSRDQTVRLWNVDTGELVRTFSGHSNIIWDVRLDAAGERVAAASWDRTLRIWETATGRLLHVLEGHEAPVYGVAFMPDGRGIVSTGSDGSVRLWNLEKRSHRVLAKLPARASVPSVHPDGKRIAVPLSDGTTHVIDDDGETTQVLPGHSEQTTVAAYSADGKRLASVADDGNMRVWEAATGRPQWRAPVMLRRPARLLSHRGWTAIDEAMEELPEAQWRTAVEAEARFAEQSPAGDLLCMRTHDDRVVLWDLDADAKRVDEQVVGFEQVFAVAHGCVVRASDGVRLYRPGEEPRVLASGACEAIGVGATGVLVAREERISIVDMDGDPIDRRSAGVGVTAVGSSDGFLVVGYRDGTIEAHALGNDVVEPTDFFEPAASGPVTRIMTGPMDTVIAGYANGTVAMWNLLDGVRLAHARLHGPVAHLAIEGHRLYAASALGRSLVWDLEVFSREYCDVLRDVWREVPATWHSGRAVPQDPPLMHPCR